MRGLLKRCDCGCRGSSRRRSIARFRAVLFHCTRVERSCNAGKKVRRATHVTKGKPSHQRERLEHRAQCASKTNARAETHTMAPPTHCVPIAHLSRGPSRSRELRSAPFSFSFHSQRPSTQKRRIGIITRTVACSAAAHHTATAPRCFLCISHSCVLALLILIVIPNHDWQDWSRYAHARAHASTLTREGASASHAIPVPSCTPCVSHMAVLEWKRWKRVGSTADVEEAQL